MQLPWNEMLWHRLTAWRFYAYPSTEPLPPKPWHPDGDDFLVKSPARLHPKSGDFIRHLESTGGIKIGTGSTKPNLGGKVDGYPLNRAWADDDLYVISRKAGKGNIWVHTGFNSTYGAVVRYRPSMVVQGNPMQIYSDHKLHIYDEHGDVPTITELQGFVDLGGGALRCDGATQYHLDTESWAARGRSSARLPLAELTLRYDDLIRHGWVQRASMGVRAGSGQFIFPAMDSDGPSVSVSAPPFGLILRLKESARSRMTVEGFGRGTNPQANAVMDCYSDKGIIVVDTGGHNATHLEPDNRWDQRDLAALSRLKITDFECWTL